MDDVTNILLRGGPVALILAVGLALKYLVQGFASWRSEHATGRVVAPVTDAATTNALLLDTLRMERAESTRKDARIDELEHEVNDLRDQLWEQRRTYESEIGELRSKIQEVTIQLEGLQARISAGLPDNTHH